MNEPAEASRRRLVPSMRFRRCTTALALLGAVAACRGGTINEPPTIAATVYGSATVANEGVAGRTITALGYSLTCQQPLGVLGSAQTDAAGRYRIVLGGSTPQTRICVRVLFPSLAGTDTVFAVDTVDVRTTGPYDSVRVDLNWAAL